MSQVLSVLMPVYNESRTLRSIIDRVLSSPVDLDIELVAVDDCSSDSSLAILHELAASDPRIKVISHDVNRGKGAAIRTAISRMTGHIAIVQDSDLEYDPNDYPKVIKPILEGKADAVFGSRFAASEERRVLLYWHSLGNKLLTWLANVLNDLNLTDMETCYKAIRADVLRDLRLQSDRFGIEPEITTRLAQWGARLYEVPISYHGRTYAEGKNIGWRDGVQAVWLLFKYRFLDTRFSNHEGHSTLESLSAAGPLNRWILDQFYGFMGKRVLEAGAGIGNLTSHLIGSERLIAVDVDPFYARTLGGRFGHLENVNVLEADLTDPTFYQKISDEDLDTVVCVNVLEHLDDPLAALRGFHDVLTPGGHALVLVPAHQRLFSATDEALEHRFRYEPDQLEKLLVDAGFNVQLLREFNRAGVLGWWINKLTGRTTVGKLQTRLFVAALPLVRLVERLDTLPGLSLVAVARRD